MSAVDQPVTMENLKIFADRDLRGPELAQQFETSQVTIRKDLEILHSHGLVHRTHGGALPSREGALEDPTLREKEKLHRKEKLHIAQAAARMVKEGQVVILDSGTTTTAVARALRKFQNLRSSPMR